MVVCFKEEVGASSLLLMAALRKEMEGGACEHKACPALFPWSETILLLLFFSCHMQTSVFCGGEKRKLEPKA